VKIVEKKLPVSELNIRKTALRLLGQNLVSPEVTYIQKTLGTKATQQDLDQNVLAVRELPWAKIANADWSP